MKKLLLFTLLLVIAACSSRTGHLTGTLGRQPFNPEIPIGMVYVPAGSYNMGENDEDVPFLHQTRVKTVSIQALYMDQTEITNNEYRQFVDFTKDSIAREKLYIGYESDEDASEFINYADRYFDEGELAMVDFELGDREPNRTKFSLNWDRKLDYAAEENLALLIEMYYPGAERFYARKEIDTRKLNFRYWWLDYREAARKGTIDIVVDGYASPAAGGDKVPEHRELNTDPHPFTTEKQGQDKDMGFFNKKGQNNAIRGHENRQRFIIEEVINVYPDTLCWVRDFTYSFHDPMTQMYFWHPAYDNYPVVGVTWVQARAFSVWRTHLLNDWRISMGEVIVQDFRLPTEAEWERCSRGDLALSPYPWGGPYIRNEAGCFLGNFKPMRGRYFEDGGFHTVKANSYNPNGWGLYCMAGNVSEWCETAYDESMNEFSHDMNTDFRYDAMDWDPPVQKRKVIRGGSWKDVGYYLQNATRSYEFQDTSKCYVGFRNVATHLGRGGRDMSREGNEDSGDINLR
jgi:formylglycine-generating enzyme